MQNLYDLTDIKRKKYMVSYQTNEFLILLKNNNKILKKYQRRKRNPAFL